jgi:hypothetical protein
VIFPGDLAGYGDGDRPTGPRTVGPAPVGWIAMASPTARWASGYLAEHTHTEAVCLPKGGARASGHLGDVEGGSDVEGGI